MFFTGCDATLLVSSSTKMNHTLSHSGLLLTSCFLNIVSKIIKLPYGGPGGIRTRVLNPFQSTSYHHNSLPLLYTKVRKLSNYLYKPFSIKKSSFILFSDC